MQAGALVTPSVRLVRELGRGGMGSVWIAEHRGLRTDVVVKLMRPELATDGTSLQRFRLEAAAAAQVKSPHAVQILDVGTIESGEPYIVMELLAGEDLRTVLDRRGPLALDVVSTVVSQIARALDAAHAQGVVHRDIKPENVFLCRSPDDSVFVKVLDFGIAKVTVFDSLPGTTRTGSLLGTPYYMSPEQVVDSKRVDPRTDVWALGVLAYEAIVGARPFEGETIAELAVAILHAPMPRPSQRAVVPATLDGWFARACAREPSERFASAGELARSLEQALRSPDWAATATLPLGSVSVTADDPPSPTSSRAPILWMVVGIVTMVGVVTIGLFAYAHRMSASAHPDRSAPTVSATSASPPPSAESIPLRALTSATASLGPTPIRSAPPATRPSASTVKPATSFDRNAIE